MMVQFLQKKSSIWWVLGINLVLRLLVLLFTNLGNDEVYYVLYALFPDWSYFDHPPMVGWIIRLFSFNSQLILNDFFVRFGALVLGTVNLYLVYRLGILLKDRLTGLVAAILLSASFYSSIIVGAFVLPDTPQSTFWLLSILSFLLYIFKKKPVYLLLFGAAVGFAMLSKYHAVYLWLGAFIYLSIHDRKAFLKPTLWFSGVISLALFAPVVCWNLTSEYSGIAYHAHRVGNDSLMPTMKYFFPEFFGQVFYNNPFNFYLIVVALLLLYRNRKALMNPAISFLVWVSLPLVFTTLSMSFFNKTLPHWSGPSYFGLVLVAVYVFHERDRILKGSVLKTVIIGGSSLMILLILLVIVQINTAFLPSKANVSEERLGKNDFVIDIGLWDEIGARLDSEISNEVAAGKIAKDCVVLTHNWFPASHLDYYYAIPSHKRLFVYGERNNQHLYLKINKERGSLQLGSDAVYISASNYFKPPGAELKAHFQKVADPIVIPITVRGKKMVNIFVWEMRNLKSELELTIKR